MALKVSVKVKIAKNIEGLHFCWPKMALWQPFWPSFVAQRAKAKRQKWSALLGPWNVAKAKILDAFDISWEKAKKLISHILLKFYPSFKKSRRAYTFSKWIETLLKTDSILPLKILQYIVTAKMATKKLRHIPTFTSPNFHHLQGHGPGDLAHGNNLSFVV